MTSPESDGTPGPGPAPGACDSCGRFIGPADVCPFCGGQTRPRLGLRALRWFALLMGVGGLGILYLAAVHAETPVVTIRDITPAMNFARIRVEGVVARAPRVSRAYGHADYASFVVDDGTGQIRVAAHRAAARALDEGHRLPAKGERVAVVGSLDVPASGDVQLHVQAPEQVIVAERNRPQPAAAAPGASEAPVR